MNAIHSFLRGAAVALLSAMAAQAASWTVDLRGSGSAPSARSAAAAGETGLVRRDVLPGNPSPVPELVPGDVVTLLLFDGTRIALRLDEAMPAPLSAGRVFTASLTDGPNAGTRTAVVISDRDGLTATVSGLPGGNVVRVFRSAEGTVVEERDPAAAPTDEPEPRRPPPDTRSPRKAAKGDQSDQLVDILIAYEKGAQAWVARNGGMTNFAETAVQRMNAALANTKLDEVFRFRLVGVMGVDDTQTDVNSALDAARYGTGVWSDLRLNRDAVGADVVSVMIDNGSAYGTTGLGYSLEATTASAAANFSESPYNACLIRSVAISDTMTHETGHNLGCGHSNTQDADPGPQSFTYSSGYHFTGTDNVRYHTIMGYYTDGTYTDYKPVPCFSSPDFTHAGVPVGTAASNDNTRVLRQTAVWASAWRDRKIPLSYDVFFSPAGGTVFTGSLTVTLTPGRTGLPVRYTLDGSEPTLSSPLYDGPIVLTRTTTIRAAAVTDGVLGFPFEATYSLSDLGEGLDAPQLAWTTNPDCPWTFVADDTWDGTDAVRSTDDGSFYSDAAWLSTTVEGPAAMSFRYKIRTYTGTFSVLVDGTAQFADSRNVTDDDWHLACVTIPEGTHAVKFVFKQGGRYDGFNGAWLDAVSFSVPSQPPVLSPATTTDPATAITFPRTLSVTLSPPAGAAGTIYYTLDGTAPSADTGLVYTGPILLTATTRVRAIFVEDGKGPSAETAGLYRESHPVGPGEWTTDVDAVKAAAARDGRLIAVLLADRAGCGWSKRFYPVAESPAFLAWAQANGIYLVTADSSCNNDTDAAYSWFIQLYRSHGDSGSIYYPTLFFARPGAPATAIGKGVARNDSDFAVGTVRYLDTADSLAAGFASVLGETLPLPPTATPAGPLVDAFPLQVALANPNSGGTLYYTLDGTPPTPANGTRYTGPITISDASAVLHAAVWPDSATGLSSPIFVGSYKTIADILGTQGVAWSTTGTGTWREDDSSPATLRSGGLMADAYQATLQATVTGKGTFIFTYAFNSWTWQNTFAFAIDGKQQWQYAYNGTQTFTGTVTQEVESAGTTTFTWILDIADPTRDYGPGYVSQSGAWLSNVRWIPDEQAVRIEGVPVPYAWLDRHYPGQAATPGGYETLARSDTDGDTFPAWQEYLLGSDPTDPESHLRADIRTDGAVPVFAWTPSNANLGTLGYRYVPLGRPSMTDPSGWQPFSPGHPFFAIAVWPLP
ncbi:MAG: chitobiase/beta-hexosaminidase C-terminal domain-containing protein [Kiritimatiellae bacterium]|nr:chitobiase/beta-hexosaminidase C-terminal domain-containing protein [Kiritimatiellia bacterium]